MQEEIIENTNKDVTHNWVTTSRFIWLCQVLIALAVIVGGCYNLYTHRFMGQPKVNVPSNTLYDPKYK